MEFEPRGRTTRRRLLAVPWLAWATVAARASAHQVQPWPAGAPTPPLALTDLQAHAWSIAALHGRVVVLNFWASWCEPCREEMPSLQRLQARRSNHGVTVLTVNYKEAPPQIERFLGVRPMGLPVLLDRDGEAASAWTPRVFPSTVLIDRRGAARTTVIGALDWAGDEAQRLLQPLVSAA